MRFAGVKTAVALSLAFSAAMWQVPSAEAFSAQDAIGAVNEATQDPELMYTIYIGMPESEVAANLRGVDGQNDWELTSRSNSTSRHDFVTYQLARGAANMKQGRIVKLSATPLRNRPHMVFCSQGTSWGAGSTHGTSVGCNPLAYP